MDEEIRRIRKKDAIIQIAMLIIMLLNVLLVYPCPRVAIGLLIFNEITLKYYINWYNYQKYHAVFQP